MSKTTTAALCGWCKDRAATRGQPPKLCDTCGVCAACSAPYPERVPALKSVGRQLYCEACEPAAREQFEAQREALELERIAKAAGLAPAHRKVTIDRLRENQRAAAVQYLGNPFGNMMLVGESGTGKTWTAVAVLRELMRRQTGTGRWMSMPWLFASIRDWMADERASRFKLTQYVDALLNHDYIVLDDLGAHRATDWAIETLYLVLHRWELLDKPGGLIVTTNLSLEEISRTFGDRVASRLAHGCRLVKLEGQDLRLAPRETR